MIVGKALTVTVTACVAVHPLPFVMVIVPVYGPPTSVLPVKAILFIVPPPAAKANAVLA